MRHLLIILLIAVLPVRGWASEQMAVSMAAQQLVVAAIEPVAATGNPVLGQASKDAITAATATTATTVISATTDVAGEPISPLCKGCTTCQLCMALVTGYPPILRIASQLPPATHLSSNVSFTSAERAPGFKPPIS